MPVKPSENPNNEGRSIMSRIFGSSGSSPTPESSPDANRTPGTLPPVSIPSRLPVARPITRRRSEVRVPELIVPFPAPHGIPINPAHLTSTFSGTGLTFKSSSAGESRRSVMDIPNQPRSDSNNYVLVPSRDNRSALQILSDTGRALEIRRVENSAQALNPPNSSSDETIPSEPVPKFDVFKKAYKSLENLIFDLKFQMDNEAPGRLPVSFRLGSDADSVSSSRSPESRSPIYSSSDFSDMTVSDTSPSSNSESTDSSDSKSPKSDPSDTNVQSPELDPRETEAKSPELDPGDTEAKSPDSNPSDMEAKFPEWNPGDANLVFPEWNPGDTNAKSPELDPSDTEAKTPEMDPSDTETKSTDSNPGDTGAKFSESEQSEMEEESTDLKQCEYIAGPSQPNTKKNGKESLEPKQDESIAGPSQLKKVKETKYLEPNPNESGTGVSQSNKRKNGRESVEPKQDESTAGPSQSKKMKKETEYSEPKQREAESSQIPATSGVSSETKEKLVEPLILRRNVVQAPTDYGSEIGSTAAYYTIESNKNANSSTGLYFSKTHKHANPQKSRLGNQNDEITPIYDRATPTIPDELIRTHESNKGLPSIKLSFESVLKTITALRSHIDCFARFLIKECCRSTLSEQNLDFFKLSFITFREEEYQKVLDLLYTARPALKADEVCNLFRKHGENVSYLSRLNFAYFLIRMHQVYDSKVKKTSKSIEDLSKTVHSIKGWMEYGCEDSDTETELP